MIVHLSGDRNHYSAIRSHWRWMSSTTCAMLPNHARHCNASCTWARIWRQCDQGGRTRREGKLVFDGSNVTFFRKTHPIAPPSLLDASLRLLSPAPTA